MPVLEATIKTRHAVVSTMDTRGDGYPVLLLHGSGSSKNVFARQFVSSLAENFRLIAIDLPGHGHSGDARDATAAYTIQGFAECVSDVLDELRLKRLAILGWSLGGHVGIELLSRHPAVSGLMIVGAPPVSPGPLGMLRAFQTNWDLLLASKETFSQRDVLRFNDLCFGGKGTAAQLADIRRADGRVRPIFVRSMMTGQGCDQRKTVEQSQVPIAIVNGDSEPFTRLSYVHALHYSNLWTDRCHIIPNAGHAPFWDQSDHFNSLLRHFVEDTAAFELQQKRAPRLIATA